LPGIENITDKIIEDAKKKAALIIAGAEEKSLRELETVTEEAKRERERILSEAKALALRQKEQIYAKRSGEIRDKKIAAKQKTIDRVFSESLKRLENLEPGEFESFAAGVCRGADIGEGDLILMPEKYRDTDIKKIDARLSLYSGERQVSGGFVLISGGVEQNNTFSALLDFKRNDIEPKLISILF
jgi:V/A-type H+-transporting ATPase subunit E